MPIPLPRLGKGPDASAGCTRRTCPRRHTGSPRSNGCRRHARPMRSPSRDWGPPKLEYEVDPEWSHEVMVYFRVWGFIYIYISIMEDIIVLVVDASSITFLNKKSTNLGVSWLAWIGLWGFPGTDLYGGYSWVTPEMIKQNIEKSLHIEGLVGFSNRTFRWPTEISFVGSQAKKQSHWEPKMHSWLVFHGGKTKTSVVGRWCWSWKRVCGCAILTIGMLFSSAIYCW